MFVIDWIRALFTPLLLWLLAGLGLASLSGCVIAGRNNGELYFEFGTKIALGHTTTQGPDVEDTVSIHSQPLEDWLTARANEPFILEITDGETEEPADGEGLDGLPDGTPDTTDEDSS